jgi:hypothetical protein
MRAIAAVSGCAAIVPIMASGWSELGQRLRYAPKAARSLAARDMATNEPSPRTAATAGALLVPPHDLAAERAVLAAVLVADRVFYRKLFDRSGHHDCDALPLLGADDFYDAAHRAIWESMAELEAATLPVTVETVSGNLSRRNLLARVGGTAAVASIAASSPGELRRHARIVYEHGLMRRLIDTVDHISRSVAPSA